MPDAATVTAPAPKLATSADLIPPDVEAERSLLAALVVADEPTRRQIETSLIGGTFTAEREVWQAFKRGEPGAIPGNWEPAPDPHAVAGALVSRAQCCELLNHIRIAAKATDPAEMADVLQNGLTAYRRGARWSKAGERPQRAVDLAAEVVRQAREARAQFERTGKPVMGIPTGIGKLDKALNGLNPGLTILAGGPGVGKTTLAVQCAVHAAREDCAVYVTFENSPENLTRKAIAARANINPANIVRGVVDLARFEQAALEWAREAARLTIIPGRADLTVADVRTEAEQTMKRTGASRCLVVADYLQTWAKGTAEFRQAYVNVRDRVEALAIALRQDLAMALDSPVLALASQTRSKSGGNDDESYGSTSLDSLKESGDLEYGADAVLILTRSKKRVATERTARAIDLTIRKNRDGESDAEVPLIFRPDLATFREAADNE